MIQKTTILFLAFIFQLSTNGIYLIEHFCSNKLVAISLNNTLNEDECCGTENELTTNCCNNESIYLKLSNDFLKENGAGFKHQFAILGNNIIHQSTRFFIFCNFTKYSFTHFKAAKSPPIYITASHFLI